MTARKIILSVFIIVFTFQSNAQVKEFFKTDKPSDSASIGQLALYDLKQGIKSVGHSFTRPLHWKKKDFITLGTVVASSLALSTLDDEGSALFIRNERHVPNIFQEAGTRFGSPQVYFIANATLYGVGLFTKNEKLRKTSVLIISSSFTTGLIQSFTKTAVGRARPGQEGLNSRDFRFWDNRASFHSFPSGHTVLSITMAHSIAKQFGNPWTKASIYTLGAVAPISRLFAGAHWLTDIGIGAVLSIAVVDAIDKFLFKTDAYDYPDHYPKKEKKISWNFAFGGDKIGFVGRF
ncbi:phosphatase PAP2 family protein [Winogradskyella immobilis]|uniref:Phosphatase PAP2 family protein n=1 Tax=Winogradskyella immobilis TaxID=2816852 RepID=A0ABS8ELY9_9FLAO|nr:phosphatase PAP2 family protein [Winogradskyella immobilis]MCC1484229.1 phosphatase PAP2 family protein [Winogradskyella immobilis]MCG0016321.1 phosphatase PAP2 family protein [Winogradskyella immobilis]